MKTANQSNIALRKFLAFIGIAIYLFYLHAHPAPIRANSAKAAECLQGYRSDLPCLTFDQIQKVMDADPDVPTPPTDPMLRTI